MESVQNKTLLKGGEWLIKESSSDDTFIREDFTEEHKMIYDMCRQFIKTEVHPILDRIDSLEKGLMRSLLTKAGEQGLLGTSFPEELGGLGKDFITSTIITEGLGDGFSFSVAISAHAGIGSLPIFYFGTEAQQQKYIPKLASGEWIGSYGLTEPNAGSDALSAKTTARLSDDGKFYLLNGQKCWITNGGFADVYTVFAKVDGDKFTGFIVERGYEGFTQGPEEHKMGIKGSSTVQLYFQDCKVPVENVLGEIGKGHLIAFNILNIGRLKLCAATTQGAKSALNMAVEYAINREQFKISISRFGAIKDKLANMAICVWASESALYRTVDWIEEKQHELEAKGQSHTQALLGAAEEYAIECAILKVYGSETLDFVADEGLQIHGGNGFSDEYLISKVYRDSRINRIYEGTNEINRLLILDMTLKRAMKGRLDLMGPAMAVSNELMSIPDFNESNDRLYDEQKKHVSNFKKAILMVAGAAVQKLMMNIDKEQEVLMNLADMAIDTFLAESCLLRLMKLAERNGEQTVSLQKDIVDSFIYDAADRINKHGKDALNAFADGDELRIMHIGLKRFIKVQPYNSKAAKRRIADKMIAEKQYAF